MIYKLPLLKAEVPISGLTLSWKDARIYDMAGNAITTNLPTFAELGSSGIYIITATPGTAPMTLTEYAGWVDTGDADVDGGQYAFVCMVQGDDMQTTIPTDISKISKIVQSK